MPPKKTKGVKGKGKARGKKITKSVSLAVKAYVKKAIHVEIENKSVQINFGSSFGNVFESPTFNAYPMNPLAGYWGISQGITQGTRVGNVIKPVKVMLNYILRPTAYDITFNTNPQPCEVQMFLGYVKSNPCEVPLAADINLLFQNGSSSSAPIGSLRDIISIVNTDYWVIKKRWTHKIGYASATGTGGNIGNQFFANNDFKMNVVKRLPITQYIPNKVVFNDGATNTVTTKNLFLMYYAVGSNGNVYSATQLPVNIEFWIDYVYEDA